MIMVQQDGSLVVPELGPVSVSGLTFLELKELSLVVSERIIGTEVFISPAAFRQISVMVVGEVEKPGNYLLSALATRSMRFTQLVGQMSLEATETLE